MKITGIDALIEKLKRNANMDDVKNAVKLNGAELQGTMQRNASFVKGYQTGTIKRSINMKMEPDGLTAIIAPETEYASYLEYGTRFMSAQPFIAISFQMQKPIFLKDLMRLVK